VKTKFVDVLTMVKLLLMDRPYPKEITVICAHARQMARLFVKIKFVGVSTMVRHYHMGNQLQKTVIYARVNHQEKCNAQTMFVVVAPTMAKHCHMVKMFPREITATCVHARPVDKLFVKIKFVGVPTMVRHYHMGNQFQKEMAVINARVKHQDKCNAQAMSVAACIMARIFNMASLSKLIHVTHALVKVLDRLNALMKNVDAHLMEEQLILERNSTEMNVILAPACKMVSLSVPTIQYHVTVSIWVK